MEIFKDWEKIPLEVYKNTLNEVKEYFYDIQSEEESITNKSIRLILVFTVFVVSAGSILLTNQAPYLLLDCINSIFLVFFCYNIYRIRNVIDPRDHYNKGLEVENIITRDFSSDTYTDSEKIKLSYRLSIEGYQIKIDEMIKINGQRANLYRKNLIRSIYLIGALIVYAAAMIRLSIYSQF